jgi:hypothetical protein
MASINGVHEWIRRLFVRRYVMHVEYQCRNFIYTHRHTDTQTHDTQNKDTQTHRHTHR